MIRLKSSRSAITKVLKRFAPFKCMDSQQLCLQLLAVLCSTPCQLAEAGSEQGVRSAHLQSPHQGG